eukprot:augustus_masked-scaffold_5-processed-gene-1.4-mRNA-1 protein AED:0.27 eAED:0.31 QI:0/-1/0/1/-1/1/1/0/215
MNKEIRVVLGSSSIWRRQLLDQSVPEIDGISFKTFVSEEMVPDIDEKAIRHAEPKDLVEAITRAKTDEVLRKVKENDKLRNIADILICGDMIVACGSTIYEKPVDASEAKKQLQSYALNNEPAACVACVEATDLKSGKRIIKTDVANVFLKEIPDGVVQGLVEKKDIFTCAGSLVHEDELMLPYITKTEGELETVMGLPKTVTQELIKTLVKEIA